MPRRGAAAHSRRRDALIRDTIAGGDWRAHLGWSPSPFVNAATWGLPITGKLTATPSETGLSASLTRPIGRGGEPPIRAGVDRPMRLMGEQFATGRIIAEALRRARRTEARGFTHSYDTLGEAAIHAIGGRPRARGIHAGPGISIKLSAPHPRYVRAKRTRVLDELTPRARALARLARRYDIGLNSTPRRPTASTCRSTSWGRSPPTRSSPAGTASASSSRPTGSAARS